MTVEKPCDADLNASLQAEYAAFGEVEVVPLSRIQRVAAGALARSWQTIPHVTHHDEADITLLEATRKALAEAKHDSKISPLIFVIKAVVEALRSHPKLNASLDTGGTNLILKKYFNIGIAIDTPSGLVVGVIRDCERKSLTDIADELTMLSHKARGKGLSLAEMSGGCFTVSSLGGIGGTAFTPIIRAPEVAILGVAKAQWKPTLGADEQIDWRLMLPLSLSYDHRAVNGADAARFLRALTYALAQPAALL
jgi:pyruvate dehydrogenase E2 component (dihydrolipoamide acetyltransferase)